MRSEDTIRAQLELDTRALALPAGRRVGQPGHDIARDYILGRLERLGLEPFHGDSFALPYTASLPFTGEEYELTNLVARVRGTERDLPPVLIGAHYDSVIDAPCADDNATAVAVALAAAETFRRNPLRRDVIIAVFDAEEPPYFLGPAMGSIRWYDAFGRDIRFACAVIMDLIGHDIEFGSPEHDASPEIRELLFVLGSESHGTLPPAVERAADGVDGLRVLPTLNSYVGDMSDHRAFRLAGQPYLFLTCGRGQHYHTPQDTVEWVNFKKVERVHEFVVTTLRQLDAQGTKGDLATTVGAPEVTDADPQAAFEIRMIERALGATYEPLLERLGLWRLSSRADIDRFVGTLRAMLFV